MFATACSHDRSPCHRPVIPLPQEANTAFKIRAVVEGSLPESLHKIPIEKRFTKDYVRNVRRGSRRAAGKGLQHAALLLS